MIKGNTSPVYGILIKISLLFGSVLVFALASEGGVRVYQWWEQSGSISPVRTTADSILGWKLIEGFEERAYLRGDFDVIEQSNLAGLRSNREYGAKPKNATRILLIGDSFIYGPGVEFEDTFGQQLDRMLHDQKASRQFEVINAGVPAYDTWQEWKLLERIGPSIKPDLVLVGFFIGNDISQNALRFQENAEAIEEKEEKFYAPETHQARVPIPFKQMLTEYSAAYRFFRERYHQLLRLIRVRQKPEGDDVWWLDIYRKDLPPGEGLGYANTDTLLTRIVTWSDRHNAKLMIVLIPEQGQVMPQHWEQTIGDMIAFDADAFDLSKPNRWLQDFGKRADVPVIDLLPFFKAIKQPEALFFNQDSHWSSYGHRVAAETVARFMITQNHLGNE